MVCCSQERISVAPEEGASTRQMVQTRSSCSAGSRKHACRSCVQIGHEPRGASVKTLLMSSAGASHASCVSSGMSMLTYLRGAREMHVEHVLGNGAKMWESAGALDQQLLDEPRELVSDGSGHVGRREGANVLNDDSQIVRELRRHLLGTLP